MPLVPAWHPVVVHFPLALIATAACLLSVAAVLPASKPIGGTLAIVGTWTLGLGAVGLLFALGTGLAAVIDLHVGDAARQAISSHVKSAILTTILVLAAAVWRCAGVPPQSRPSGMFLLLMWLATGSLTVTGYRGGQNVYEHGVGVRAAALMARPPR